MFLGKIAKYIVFGVVFLLLPLISGSFAAKIQANNFTVVLDWFANANHAPILVASKYGIFKKYGLEVKVISPADPTDPPKWIAIGKADLAIDYQPHVIVEIAQGLPIEQVGTLIRQPLNCLVVLASSPIHKLDELKSQTIAYSSPQIDLIFLQRMLQKVNVHINQVQPINVHYSLLQALLTKKTMAAIGIMRNIELVELQSLGQPGRAFYPEDYGVPSYSELVFIAKKGVGDERLKRFFLALNESQRYLAVHPEETFQQILVDHPELKSPANRAMWLKTIPLFSGDFSKVDWQQYRNLEKFLNSVETKN
jgi:putative hydroxymethylpyrimidine transport system substrate-binding protein